jgi:hypothetical protein
MLLPSRISVMGVVNTRFQPHPLSLLRFLLVLLLGRRVSSAMSLPDAAYQHLSEEKVCHPSGGKYCINSPWVKSQVLLFFFVRNKAGRSHPNNR